MLNNKSKNRILVIRDYYPSDNNPSSSTWVYNQVVNLQQNGYNPLVISPTPINPLKKFLKNKYRLYDDYSNKIEIYKNTSVIRPGYFKVPNNIFVGFTFSQLEKCLYRFKSLTDIKLIHAHFGQNGAAAINLKKKLRVPLITSFYGYDSGRLGKKFKPFYKELIEEGDIFLALSEDMKVDLLNLGFPEKKIMIHHLGIEFSEFNYIKKPYLEENGKINLLTVARLDEVKGIQYVLLGLSDFLKKYPIMQNRIKYLILGGGVYENKLKKLVTNLSLTSQVEFMNNLICKNSRELVKNAMNECDIFCLCSFVAPNGAKEGTPVVLMEAQACGKPCISTYHAGIPEIVINKKTGILVNEKSINEISNAIELLSFDSSLRNKYGENAYNHIKNEFNNDIQMKKLFDLYDSLINYKT